MESTLASLKSSGDVLFMMLGAVMIFSMHAGFAFLELGTVRRKNQVNALVKILSDWSVSTVVYFLIGFPLAYGISFLKPAGELMTLQGFDLVHFFFLLTFAACIPAIISGGIAERAKFWPQVVAGGIFVGLLYPFFESLIWGRMAVADGQPIGLQAWFASTFGFVFHDYAGSVVVHSMGGWIALPAVLILGSRLGRYGNTGKSYPIPVSSIPFLSLGSWILAVGWFGFNVMSAQSFTGISGLVAVNSLMAMVGGVLVALVMGRNDPGFVHNGALAGLIAICAGSDIVHPLSALVIGGVGAAIFVKGFHIEQEKLKIDDVLGVWPLHGVTGTWGGIAAGIFGSTAFGGIGGVSFLAQLAGSLMAACLALAGSFVVYAALHKVVGIRLTEEQEMRGADLAIHSIDAYPEEGVHVGRG
ncbi:MAG: ammonium transporter [Nitrospirae bacterium]|nr:ammonium transporter [Nitrospirota bacterium]